MISFGKWAQLNERLRKLGVSEHDLEELFIRSSGHGGQNVNKVNSCVYIKHLPSSIEVKCQQTRSQQENRYHARIILAEKLENKILGAQSAKAKEIHKLRKQKQKRSKRAKEKMLAHKKIQSNKKTLRRPPAFD